MLFQEASDIFKIHSIPTCRHIKMQLRFKREYMSAKDANEQGIGQALVLNF